MPTLTGSSIVNRMPSQKKNPSTFLAKFARFLKKLVISLLILGIAISVIPRGFTEANALQRIYNEPEDLEPAPVAIVFGAGLTRAGTVSRVLRDRVDAAVVLYQNGVVEKLLMTGDNRFIDYNEPGAMFDHAVSQGVSPDDIVLDFAGRRTYDSCYRARAIFGVEHAILVTQRFHLPRAIFLCNSLGVNASGFNADGLFYRKRSRIIWNIREIPATLVALFDIWITQPLPVLGEQEPIFP